MSELERRSVERIITAAEQLGVDIPEEVRKMTYTCSGRVNHGAMTYWRAHPDLDEFDPDYVDCYGSAENGISGCDCWEPVYDVDQAEPQIPGCDIRREDFPARVTMCGDCAFRPGSPERETQWHREELFALADRGEPFFCHDGMRRPILWRHPTLGEVPGDPDDWQPPIIDGLPFQADGSPGLLCAGSAARRAVAEVLLRG